MASSPQWSGLPGLLAVVADAAQAIGRPLWDTSVVLLPLPQDTFAFQHPPAPSQRDVSSVPAGPGPSCIQLKSPHVQWPPPAHRRSKEALCLGYRLICNPWKKKKTNNTLLGVNVCVLFIIGKCVGLIFK